MKKIYRDKILKHIIKRFYLNPPYGATYKQITERVPKKYE